MSFVDRVHARPRAWATIALAAIILVSTLIRILVNANVAGPWIFVDEMIYSDLGRSALGGSSIRGVPISGYGIGYPLLIAPAYAVFEDLVTAFAFVKATNAVLMSFAAVPVYFIARLLMARLWAMVASLLSVLVPAMAYSGVVMTENAFYPAFCLASMLMIFALLRPTALRQILVWPSIVVCFEVRSQGGVLAVAFLMSVVVVIVADAILDRETTWLKALGKSARRYWITFALVVAGICALLLYLHRAGRTVGSIFGAYAVTTEATDRYQVKPVVAWVLLHIAELDLWLGVIPFVALLVLVGRACMKSASRELRVVAISSVVIIGLMALVVGAFVVFSNVGRIEERNLFYVGIFPLIALCWWVAEGLPRGNRWFVLALVVAAGLPLAIPYQALINQTAASDTFGLYLPWALSEHLFDPNLTAFAVAVGSFGAAALVLLIREKRAVWMIGVVAAFFVATSIAVNIKTDRASAGAVAQGIAGHRDWVDAVVGTGADVSVVYPGASEPLKVWQNEFFNRSIRGVFTIAVPLPGGLPETIVNAAPDGRVIGRAGEQIDAGIVLAHDSTSIAGTVIARDRGARMELVRATAPLRFLSTTTGIYDDGWTGGAVVYTNYACAKGIVRISVRLDKVLHTTPVTVTPYVGDQRLSPVQVSPDGTPQMVDVPVVPKSRVCTVRYVVDPLVVPSQTIPGAVDPRPLGVLMSSPTLVGSFSD
jgi:hypothetical protein